MTEIKTIDSSVGQIQISDEVLAVIAGTAAFEIEGVVATTGNITGEIAHMFGVKSFSKGVSVEVLEDSVNIGINITVKFGYKIHEVSEEVQKRVKSAIETMTGLNVTSINVTVIGVHFEKETTIEE